MTLDLSPERWRDRIARWDSVRNGRRKSYDRRVRGYAGPGYYDDGSVRSPGEVDENYEPINHTFNAISRWLPQLVYGNPQVKVGTSRTEGQRDAQALELALNRINEQSNARQLNEMLAVDFWIGPLAICLTTNEPREGFSEFEDPPYWPTDHRIPPFDFVYDIQETNWKNWRYMGHRVVMDWDDAKQQAEDSPELGWDLDVLNLISPGIPGNEPPADAENREEFEYYEIYCPEVRVDDLRALGYDLGDEDEAGREYTPAGGYHGAIFYIVTTADAGEHFVRAPSMFWGPRGGPYTLYPGYFVPNETLPLSPDMATVAQAEGANTAARAVLRGIERRKNLGLIASSMPDLQQSLDAALDGDMVSIKDATADNLRNRVFPNFEVGGVTDQMLGAAEYTMQMLERSSGMDDQQRGRVESDATATASAIAARASSSQLGFLELKFRESEAEKQRKKAWYLWHDERAEVELGEAHGFQLYRGGDPSQIVRRSPELHDDLKAATGMEDIEDVISMLERRERQERELRQQDPFDAMDFQIEPYSMARTQEGMQQVQLANLMQTFSWLPEAMARYPFIEWDDVVRWLGDVGNTPGLDRMFSMKKLAAFQKLTIGAQFEGMGQDKQPPRLTRDQGPHLALGGGQQRQRPGFGAARPENPMAGKNTGAQFGSMNKQGAA